nr:uncharacterized protein LOC109178464 [Ipomoea batatas]
MELPFLTLFSSAASFTGQSNVSPPISDEQRNQWRQPAPTGTTAATRLPSFNDETPCGGKLGSPAAEAIFSDGDKDEAPFRRALRSKKHSRRRRPTVLPLPPSTSVRQQRSFSAARTSPLLFPVRRATLVASSASGVSSNDGSTLSSSSVLHATAMAELCGYDEYNPPIGVESDSLIVCNVRSSSFDGDHDDIPDAIKEDSSIPGFSEGPNGVLNPHVLANTTRIPTAHMTILQSNTSGTQNNIPIHHTSQSSPILPALSSTPENNTPIHHANQSSSILPTLSSASESPSDNPLTSSNHSHILPPNQSPQHSPVLPSMLEAISGQSETSGDLQISLANNPPLRRSTRIRRPNTKYINDKFVNVTTLHLISTTLEPSSIAQQGHPFLVQVEEMTLQGQNMVFEFVVLIVKLCCPLYLSAFEFETVKGLGKIRVPESVLLTSGLAGCAGIAVWVSKTSLVFFCLVVAFFISALQQSHKS